MELNSCRYCGCDQIQWDERERWAIPFSRYCRNCRTYGPYKKTLEEADEAWNVLMSPCTDKQAQSELLSTLRPDRIKYLVGKAHTDGVPNWTTAEIQEVYEILRLLDNP